MDGVRSPAEAPAAQAAAGLAPLAGLFGEINDLKRVRGADDPASVSARLFRRSWAALAAGEDPGEVALRAAADTVASARLGAVDAAVLARCGLTPDEAREVLEASFAAVGGPLDRGLAEALRRRLGAPWRDDLPVPDFVTALAAQPRAGATCPGKPRLVLEPPESHAEHCMTVAAYAVLVAPLYGAEPGDALLLGLAHHFHNAVLPDSGFTGEMLLGRHLEPIMERLTEGVLATLPAPLAARIRTLRPVLGGAEAPAARAFHAADVIDRVLQMQQYARVAAFTVDQALDDLELVHAGPVQSFHYAVLREVGLA